MFSAGSHTIHSVATLSGSTYDETYNLTVE
jgi:hypothetical protein